MQRKGVNGKPPEGVEEGLLVSEVCSEPLHGGVACNDPFNPISSLPTIPGHQPPLWFSPINPTCIPLFSHLFLPSRPYSCVSLSKPSLLHPPSPLSSSLPSTMGNCCSQGNTNDGPATDKGETVSEATNNQANAAPDSSVSPQKPAAAPSSSAPASSGSTKPSKPAVIGPVLGRPMEDVRTLYSIGKELGRGQFGVTHLCTSKATGEQFACKTIAKRKLVNKEDIEDVRREVQIMHHLTGQPNIVELKGAYEDKQSVHLVMELCAGGELFDRIISKGHYTERGAASLLRTIVQIVHTCHSMGVVHRDLKPENFLLLNKEENAPLKATDFGLSVFFKQGFKSVHHHPLHFNGKP